MSWRCHSCGIENPNSADACNACGGKVAAPSRFYFRWVIRSAFFVLVVYLIGTFFGRVFLEISASPTDRDILTHARADGAKGDDVTALDPSARAMAKTKAIALNKSHMSDAMKTMLYWFLPVILVFICGGVVGFMADGRTILEVGLGSVIGQFGGFSLQRFVFQTDTDMLVVVLASVIVIFAATFGAWVGEILQGNQERAA